MAVTCVAERNNRLQVVLDTVRAVGTSNAVFCICVIPQHISSTPPI